MLVCLHVCLLSIPFSAFHLQFATCQAQVGSQRLNADSLQNNADQRHEGDQGRIDNWQPREYTKEHPLVYEDAWDLWPYVFLDDNGLPSGYNVDLLTILLNELNIPFVINLKPTSQALEDLQSGKSDLMLGMVADFHDEYTDHYGKNVIQLFTHSVLHSKNEPQLVRTVDDLSNHQVIVHEGSFSHHLMMDKGWGDNALPMGDMDKAVQLVSAEGSGMVLWNTMSLKWLKNKYHVDNLELSSVDMPSGDYRFMSNDSKLLERLDFTFSELKASDKLTDIEKKWFFPELLEEHKVPVWLWYVAGGIGLIILLLILSYVFFKVRERVATSEGRRRTALLGLILSTCHVTVWTYDVKSKMFTRYINDHRETKQFSASEFAKHVPPEKYKLLTKYINRIVTKKDDELHLEMRFREDDAAEERTFITRLSVLRNDKDGQPETIIGTSTDTTEEHRRQQQSVDMMHRYRAVFNTAMVDMVYYDKDGRILNMNERAQKTFRMPLDAVLKEGVKLSDILPEDQFKISDFAHDDHFYATLFIDYSKEKYLESRKREGQICYELLLVPVFDDNHQLVGAYGTGREVTEVATTYRRAQQNVKHLREAMESVIDHVENINFALQTGGVRMMTYSVENHMLSINHQIHEAQYVLTQQRCIELTDPESMSSVMRAFRMMDRHRDSVIDASVRTTLRLPGGKNLWLQIHLFPIRDADGRVMHYNGVCRDATDIKHTERMLQLETEKAQEIEHVKNKFLHNMCYEIRTPLDVVVGYAEKFEQEHSPEEEELFISEIKSNSAHLLDLINDILFLSRLDAHMVEINPQPCDFSKTFESHCHMGFGNDRKEGVKYLTENQYEQLVVNIDDMNVGRAIQQVLANAVEHTHHGYVRAHYEYIGGKLIIAVEDTGEGISPQRLETIFERFNTSSSENRGTGLGMPICHELVTQLGGTIDINSEVGKGTTVWITIPCEATIVEHKKED